MDTVTTTVVTGDVEGSTGVDLSLQSSYFSRSRVPAASRSAARPYWYAPHPHSLSTSHNKPSTPHTPHTHYHHFTHPHTQDRCYRSAAELQVAGCPMFAHRAPSLHHHPLPLEAGPPPLHPPPPTSHPDPFYWTGPGHSCEPYSIQNRRRDNPC